MYATVVLTLSAAWLTIVSGLLIPLLTGLVTKLGASYTLKGFITVVLSVAAGFLASVVSSQGVVDTEVILNTFVTLGIATMSFFHVYSPAGADQVLAPNFGLGSND